MIEMFGVGISLIGIIFIISILLGFAGLIIGWKMTKWMKSYLARWLLSIMLGLVFFAMTYNLGRVIIYLYFSAIS